MRNVVIIIIEEIGKDCIIIITNNTRIKIIIFSCCYELFRFSLIPLISLFVVDLKLVHLVLAFM